MDPQSQIASIKDILEDAEFGSYSSMRITLEKIEEVIYGTLPTGAWTT